LNPIVALTRIWGNTRL